MLKTDDVIAVVIQLLGDNLLLGFFVIILPLYLSSTSAHSSISFASAFGDQMTFCFLVAAAVDFPRSADMALVDVRSKQMNQLQSLSRSNTLE